MTTQTKKERRKTGDRWGWGFVIAAAVVACALGFHFFSYRPGTNSFFYERLLPVLGGAAALVSLFIGHFSFPRVQNLKVYLLGYLSAATGAGMVVYYWLWLQNPAYIPEGAFHTLYVMVFVHFILIVIVPSFVKYRVTRAITLVCTIVEVLLLGVIVLYPPASKHLHLLQADYAAHPGYWAAPLWAAGIILATRRWLAREFFLGGILSGSVLFYAAGWMVIPFVAAAQQALVAFALTGVLYIEIGSVSHWFFRMEHRIAYDPLLHIYNRNYCSRIISERSRINTAPPFAVAMVDIDHFKHVNDTYGHQAGDAILYNTAQAICKEALPGGIVCRYGGEEITVFFQKTETKDAVKVMERVRTRVEEMKTECGRKKVSVTVSCGVSHRLSPQQSIEQVVQAADKALYRAKESGRNQVRQAKTPQPGKGKKKKR